jgi:hypothetical protein
LTTAYVSSSQLGDFPLKHAYSFGSKDCSRKAALKYYEQLLTILKKSEIQLLTFFPNNKFKYFTKFSQSLGSKYLEGSLPSSSPDSEQKVFTH